MLASHTMQVGFTSKPCARWEDWRLSSLLWVNISSHIFCFSMIRVFEGVAGSTRARVMRSQQPRSEQTTTMPREQQAVTCHLPRALLLRGFGAYAAHPSGQLDPHSKAQVGSRGRTCELAVCSCSLDTRTWGTEALEC